MRRIHRNRATALAFVALIGCGGGSGHPAIGDAGSADRQRDAATDPRDAAVDQTATDVAAQDGPGVSLDGAENDGGSSADAGDNPEDAAAADGAIDGPGAPTWSVTFGISGWFDAPADILLDDTGVYVVGYADVGHLMSDARWHVEKRALADGARLWGMTSNPTGWSEQAIHGALDSSGLYVLGTQASSGPNLWRIEKRALNDGALVGAFGDGGVLESQGALGNDLVRTIVLRGAEFHALAMDDMHPGGYRIERRDSTTGALIDGTFGAGGVFQADGAGSPIWMVADETTFFILLASRVGDATEVAVERRLRADGALDSSFGVAGRLVVSAAPAKFVPLTFDQMDGALFFAGSEPGATTAADTIWRVLRMGVTSGAVEWNVTSDPSRRMVGIGGGDSVHRIRAYPGGIYIAGTRATPGDSAGRLERRDPASGALRGTIVVDPTQDADTLQDAYLTEGALYLAGTAYSSFSSRAWRIERQAAP